MSYYPVAASRDQDRQASNARMAAIASALQGKYALVRERSSLSFIYILSADCLLNPGVKRLTSFDIHLAAAVYTLTASRSGTPQFVLTSSYANFVAYDLVALFALPSTASTVLAPSPARQAPQALAAIPEWLNVINALERRAEQPGMGGFESLPSVFADEVAINNLIRISSQIPFTPMATGFRNPPSRRDSLAPFPTMARRLSSH